MKIYECIKGFSIEECDGDGFTLENQYVDIKKGSKWECDTEDNFRVVDGEIRLISLAEKDCIWLELTQEHLQEYFKEIVNTDGDEI